MVDERRQPEFGNAFDDVVAFVIKRATKFVVFLLNLENETNLSSLNIKVIDTDSGFQKT